MSLHDENLDARDAAVSRRLARLASRPIDTARLEQRLGAALSERRAPVRPGWRWLSPLSALAASLLLAVGLLMLVNRSNAPATAAAVELTQLHRDIMAGLVRMTPAASVDDANRWIAAQKSGEVSLPHDLTDARVQSCCLRDVQGRLVAVALLEADGRRVTLVVAEAPGFAHEMGTTFEINGRRLFGHRQNGVNMMMANDGDRWLCVMGDMELSELAPIAAGIRF